VTPTSADGRVLVTGAGGFIGSATVTRLAAAGYEVHGAGRSVVSHPALTTAHTVDLLDPRASAAVVEEVRPSHLVHLAWTTAHGEYWVDARNLDWIGATLRLLQTFEHSGGRRAVLVGSCTEYDWSRPGPFAERDAGPRPGTLYGASKLATSIASCAYGEVRDLDVAWARIFHLYGPGEDYRRILPQLVRAADSGTPLELRQPHQEIDVLHVEDVAGALHAILASDLTGPFNVASGEGVTISEMAEIVGDLAGAVSHTVVGHPDAASATSVVADVGRLRDDAGFTPRYSLHEGLTHTRAWILDQAKGATH